jgi:hypothetical protein
LHPNIIGFTWNAKARVKRMVDRDFFEKVNEIFTDLLNLANEELRSNGINIEPSVIIDRIIFSSRKPLFEEFGRIA